MNVVLRTNLFYILLFFSTTTTLFAYERVFCMQRISMSLWGVKKLGQSLMDVSVPSSEAVFKQRAPRKNPVGTGVDYRKPDGPLKEAPEVVLQLYYQTRKMRMLSWLESPELSPLSKLQLVKHTFDESLLPDESAYAYRVDKVQTVNFQNGGLWKDWNAN